MKAIAELIKSWGIERNMGILAVRATSLKKGSPPSRESFRRGLALTTERGPP
jgi:hypothetical protein